MKIELNNILCWSSNFKGVNDLIIVQNGYNGEIATSTISKEQAIKNLKAKIRRENRAKRALNGGCENE